MPILSPSNFDTASQTTLVLVKAKTDNLPGIPASQGDVQTVKAKTDLLSFNASSAVKSAHTVTVLSAFTINAGSTVQIAVTGGGMYKIMSDSLLVKAQYQDTIGSWLTCTGDINLMIFFHDGSGDYPMRIINTDASAHDVRIILLS